MESKRFRIEFSGKSFPDYYPMALTIFAPDKERADEWVQKQLEAWKLSGKKIRISIVEVLVPRSADESIPNPKPKKKKRQRKRKEVRL